MQVNGRGHGRNSSFGARASLMIKLLAAMMMVIYVQSQRFSYELRFRQHYAFYRVMLTKAFSLTHLLGFVWTIVQVCFALCVVQSTYNH